MTQQRSSEAASDSSVIRTAETYPVQYTYWPAFSLWSALFLMNMADALPGQAAWIGKTRRTLRDELRNGVTLLNETCILHGLHCEQLRQDTMSLGIPDLLDWLSLLEPEEIAGMLPPIDKIRCLVDGRARFGMDDPIADWDGVGLDAALIHRMRTLIEDPECLKGFVIRTLQRFWDDHLEVEFRRLDAQLHAAVHHGNLNQRPRTHRELIRELVGREPVTEPLDGKGIERILAIPVCHMGSFAMSRHVTDADSVLLITFEAGRVPSPDSTPGTLPTASTYRALADETRLGILRLLSSEEKYGAEIVARFGLSQPTVSKHLRMLVAEGLLAVRREGGTKYYSVNPSRLAQIGRSVEDLGKS